MQKYVLLQSFLYRISIRMIVFLVQIEWNKEQDDVHNKLIKQSEQEISKYDENNNEQN